MSWQIVKCPSCGGDLNVETDSNYIFCQYCGAKLLREDNRIIIEHIDRKIDETEIRRIAFEEKQLDKSRKTRGKLGIITFILLGLGILTSTVPGFKLGDGLGGCVLIAISLWTGMIAMFYGDKPNKDK